MAYTALEDRLATLESSLRAGPWTSLRCRTCWWLSGWVSLRAHWPRGRCQRRPAPRRKRVRTPPI